MNEIAAVHQQPQKNYSLNFRMKKHPWHDAVIIFDDGTASIHKYRAKPDRPVLVEVEGEAPNQAQLETMR